MEDNQLNSPQKSDAERLFDVLHSKPISRRMAATELGYTDLTYMVTQDTYDLIKGGKTQVTGKVKCTRSRRYVQGVTTNPKYFTKPVQTQLNLF
jgi:hypothetical protein